MRPPRGALGGNRFKLGIFRMNCGGGLAITRAPERWAAAWDDIAAVARMADTAGIELILPLARWRGYGGALDNAAWSYETLTHGAALAAITSRTAIFVTVHVPLVHPVFAAKAVATIDHVSHGRVGLNIVCGWNQDEFGMFGMNMVEHDARYDQGHEWFEVFTRLVRGERFDHDGRYYTIRDAYTVPVPLQQPRPVTLSAGGSPKGRQFAAAVADYLFGVVSDMDQAKALAASVSSSAAEAMRHAGVFTISHVVCRPTQAEADAVYRYFAEEMTDDEGIDAWTGAKQATSQSTPPEVLRMRRRLAGGHGTYPLIGTPQRIAEEMTALSRAGIAGTTLSFFDFKAELPYFIDAVLPLLKQAGLRAADTHAARP
ncbi:MAG TPA: LLM class flavin-dependent oxidoreductase [Stellaceae bacterium]|nr:LLM class flavin-dependent oxidoreductase [Stellaceae bacterium]